MLMVAVWWWWTGGGGGGGGGGGRDGGGDGGGWHRSAVTRDVLPATPVVREVSGTPLKPVTGRFCSTRCLPTAQLCRGGCSTVASVHVRQGLGNLCEAQPLPWAAGL